MYTTLSTKSDLPSKDCILDFIGIGFGPSNLALALAAKEINPDKKGMFFELKPTFQWHPGMLLDGSRMQISFLKDLVTLRNPASPYTFLQYTMAKGRLERFVNLKEFHPTRVEYQDYLRWVAEAFSDKVMYGAAVRSVKPAAFENELGYSAFRIEVQNLATDETSVYYARNVVYASGGRPRVPADQVSLSPGIIHSSEFLHRFPQRFTERQEAYEFGVVGDGQSAGEIVAELLRRYPKARVHLFVSGYAPRQVDNSPFVNETFFSTEAESFYRSSAAMRKAMRSELRVSNYGVIDREVIDEIYRCAYLDEVKGERRLFVHRFSKLVSAEENGHGVKVKIQERCDGTTRPLRCDGLVLATGYDRSLDEAIFRDVLPFVEKDESGDVVLSRNYRVRTVAEMSCRLYVQGYGESSHGLGDTLLSLIPFRSKEIFDDICAPAAQAEHAGNGRLTATCALEHKENGRRPAQAEPVGNGRLAAAYALEYKENGRRPASYALEHKSNGHRPAIHTVGNGENGYSAAVHSVKHAASGCPASQMSRDGEYPPKRHLESDTEKLYAAIERFKFATLISVQASGEPIVTHVPLTLDRSRGSKGVLFGHMDRANPHVDLLEGRRILALFHGPNAYISPYVYETDQLPTWNSITVHVWARARVLRDQQAVVRGLMGICEQSDPGQGAYRLNAEDQRIERLIDFIIGFELEIDELIGRFKLSQDRTESDRRLAAMELARKTEVGERGFIEHVLGYQL